MKKYSRDEVKKHALDYFNGESLPSDVWINKYALKDSDDNIYELSPNDMHKRISSELYRIESKYPNPLSEDLIFNLLKDFKYIVPAGGSMSGIGNNMQTVSLSNCFVTGNKSDSYGGLLLTDQEQVQLMKRRGGVGHDLSHIRPKGTPVKNSALSSTGIVPFMERYSNSTREVAQDGRRGALMLSVSVKHIDSEDFIDAKLEQGKVTGANISVKITDDFMDAVINDNKFIQQYPIESVEPKQIKEIDAKKLWNKLVHNSWKSAEPGILFWDQVIREAIPDLYGKEWETVSTNPCVVGDTLVSVADGRNFVSIKQLAEEGNDVPVYALDKDNNIVIRTMRNPRITGYNEKIYKVTIEGGHTLRVTGNHKFKLKNGKYVQAKDLVKGDSLHIMTKLESPIVNDNLNKKDYMWIIKNDTNTRISEHRFIYEQNHNINIENGFQIHHIDYNTLNNDINNLQMMSRKEHDYLHSFDKIGEKNPYHSMSDEWKFKFASHKGETNSSYYGVSTDDIKRHALILTKKLNRRFSKRDWIEYAKQNNIPQSFSKFRQDELGMNLNELSKNVAKQLNIGFTDIDPRLVKTYENMVKNGYDVEIRNNVVFVKKYCETCGEPFWVEHRKREISFCSHECSLVYVNSNKNINDKRTDSINESYKEKSNDTKNNQVKLYSELKFDLGRKPLLKEWEEKCKSSNVPCRLKTKYGFQSYKEIEKESEFYNHKVISVELDGVENVYNGTVDDFHNFFVGGFQEITESGKRKYVSINNLNCGEIPLCPYDSCRLLSLNLYSYVENPFTKEAKFNWDLFKEHAIYGQRFMDDIVDLEIEKIYSILEKIESDPEPEIIKSVEINLWNNVIKKAKEGRRTGLGITAEGDMLAALGYKYGTTEATDFSVLVHKTLALCSYKSSIIMAKERGSFDVWKYDIEKDAPFIKRIMGELEPEFIELYKQYGRRNISNLTIAPNGSVSILTNTSSGIEPIFLPSYKRRRKVNPNDKNVKVNFVDEVGDQWEEYNVFHPKFEVWASVNGYNIETLKNMKSDDLQEIIKLSPYFEATSNDVDWVEKVNMQGKIQQWIDHSISCCLTPDMTIDTDNGLFYIDELVDFKTIKEGEFLENTIFNGKILNHNLIRTDISSFYNNGIKSVFKITLENGLIIKSTDNERLLNNLDEWVMVKNLNVGDLIKIK